MGRRPPRRSPRSGWAGSPCPRRRAPSSPRSPRSQVELREQGLSRVVLCGMGGSSLAPEVICGAAGVELDVLDSSDPDFVRTALEDRLAETVVVVSSKSGGTVETDSQRRAFEKAFTRRRHRPRRADRRRHRPRLAPREVGPRRGLPGLPRRPDGGRSLLRADRVRAGAERARRRRHRRAARRGRGDPRRPSRPTPPTTPGCGSVPCSAVANLAGVDKLVLADGGRAVRRLRRLGRAAVAESTGKDGKGILPVVVEGLDAPNFDPEHPRRGAVHASAPTSTFDTVRPASRRAASPSTRRWARSCCCGSTPPPSPAG